MEDKLYKAWQSAGKYYDLPDFDTFKEDMKDEGKLHRFHESLGKYYDVPDYDTFKADMWGTTAAEQRPTGQAAGGVDNATNGTGQTTGGAGVTTTSAGEMVAQGQQAYKPVKPGDRQDIAVYNTKGDMVRSDTATNLGGGKVGIVQVENPYFTPATTEEEKQRYYFEKASTLDQLPLEPNEFGEWVAGWQRGSRVQQLDKTGVRFMNMTGAQGSDEFDSARGDAEKMNDSQLVQAFNALSRAITDPVGYASTREGYADATRLKAYALELHARDLGAAHDSELTAGRADYLAAMGDEGVKNEIAKQEQMPWEQRRAYLAKALYRTMTSDDQDAKRVLLAGAAIRANETGRQLDEVYPQIVGEVNNENQGDIVAHALADAEAEGQRLDEAIRRRMDELAAQDAASGGSIAQTLAGAESGPGGGMGGYNSALFADPELSMLWAARHQVDERLKHLNRQRQQLEGRSGAYQFATAAWDALTDPNTLMLDLSNLKDMSTMGLYGKKGGGMTGRLQDARQAMLSDTALANEIGQMFKDSAWQRWGDVTGYAVPYLMEFYLTGGFSGIAESVTKGLTKLGTTAAGNWIKGHVGDVGRMILRNTGIMLGDLTAAMVMENTIGLGHTGADIMHRAQGDVMRLGDGAFMFLNDKPVMEAILKGETAQLFEYYTEKMGAHLDGLMGKAGQVLGLKDLSNYFKWMTGKEIHALATNALRRGGMNEFPSEVIEEEANLLLNALFVGDNTFDLGPLKELANQFGFNFSVDKESEDYKNSIFNPETQGDIIGGMFFSIGAMRAPAAVYGTSAYYYYKHENDKAATRLQDMMGERGNELMQRIDECPNDQIGKLYLSIMTDDSLNDAQARAAVNYINTLMQVRGRNLADMKDAEDKATEARAKGEQSGQSDAAKDNEAFAEGYNAEGEAREEVQSDLQSAEQRLTDMGFDMSTFDGWTGDAFEEAIKGQEGTYSEEELSAIREYLRAKGADAGMQQRVEDDIDTLVQQASDLVDKQTNQGTGMVHRAVLNSGQEVYVTGGQLVMTGDGTMIDTEASDESLFVYNPATGQPEQYNPSDFQSVDDPVSPEQLKARAANDARLSVEQKANDDKNGVLPFQVGDTYDILMNGQPATVTVVEDQGNNVVVQRAGSAEAEIVPKRQIQQAADNMRKAKRTAQMPATLPQRRTGAQDNTAANGRVDNATDGTPVAPANTQSQAPALPMDENTGEPVWNKTTPEQGYNHLAQSGMTTEDIGTMIDDRIAQADAAIEKAAHGGTMDQRLQARQSKNYWEAVKALHDAVMAQPAATGRGATAAQGTAQPGTTQPGTAAEQRPTGQAADAATTTPAGAPAGTIRIDASQSQTMPTGYVAVNADGTRAEDRGQMGVRSEDRDYFLRTMSPRVLDLLDKVAKGLGWKIRLYNGTVAYERGMYLNGVVWVNRRTTAKELAQWILGHEMTHGMGKRTNNGTAFKSYIRLANEYKRKVWDERYGEGFYEQYIKNTIESYKKHLKAKKMDVSQVNRAYIEEEIACDVTGDLVMNNPEMLGKLFSGVDSASKKKGIIDMIVDFLDYLKSKLPFRSEERKALEDLSKRLNNLYRDAKAQTNIAKATASDEGTTIDNNDGEGSGGSFSITGNAEGSGFTCSETVMEVWRVPQPDGTYKEEEHWVKKPLLDSEGNVVFRMGEKEFSGKNPITVDDLKSNPDTILNYMLADALRAGTINETKADQVRQQYADMLNLYLEKGMATEDGNGFENLEKKWLWVGETVFRTVASNSDEQYSYSIDITKVCKKNEAVIRAISAMQVKTGYGVTPAQILEIYEETDSQGLQVPCPVCYVFSRYINNGKYATAIVNGMKKYGKYLPGQPDAKPVEWWVKEMKDAQARAEKMKTPLKNANDDVKVILQQIDTLCREITSGKLSAEEAESKRRHVRALDQRYRAALDVISQEAIPRWIKSFVIEGSEQGGWRMREDAALPENMDDFTLHALDIRKTASAMEKYPALTRYRRAGGSAGGKEITFASNNELGTIAMGLGITKSRLDDYPNYYQLAAEAETEEERQALLQKARERYDNARLYAQRQTLRGGQRMWSWSDNIESLSSDVASNLMQLELLGGALQTYSKQLEGVKMVAAMNGYVNASLMGYGDGIREVGPDDIDDNGRLSHDILDVNNKGRERIIANAGSPVYHNEADGKDYVLVFDDVVGIDPFGHNGKRGLFSLNEEYDRAGNILVGMNDIHVRAAMADPRVFFIIPWHASGMSNHILQQMFNILGVDMDTFVSTDYTKMQEETNYLLKKDDGSPKKKVPKEVEDFWDSHTFEDEFACGTGHIENGDRNGGLSDSQKHYRALRDAIFDGAVKEGTEEYDQIMADEFLSQVYRQVTTLVDDGKMTEKDKEFIYPYEYWQTTEIDENGNEVPARVENADVNGRRYVEYCRRMGFKPKFTGKFDDKTGYSPEGNFADDPGYWKLLIDRRMYDRRGNYQGLTPVDSSGLDSSMYDPDQTQEEFNVTEVATNEGAEKIADTVYQRDIDRTGSMPAPNLDMTMDEAVAKYKDVTALQASLIKAENDALKAADVAKEKAAKAREKAAQDVDGRKAKSVARAQESARKAIEAAKQAAARVDEIAEQLGTVRDDIAQYPDSTDEPKFSIADRTLMGMHNITADKLRSAIRLGGLVNPSMAVVDTEVGGFTNFGEISLIPSADLIASSTGGNAGTWAADAYSPRFPETHRRLGKGGDKKMRAWVKGLKMRQEMEYNTEEQFNDYYNGFSIRDNALVYPFLHEKGLSGEVDYTRHMKVDQRLEDDIQAANGDHYELLKRFDEDADFRKKLTDIVVGDEVRKIDRKEGESFQEFRGRRREWAKRYRESWTDENGDLLRNLANDELWKQCRAYKEDGKFDESRTIENAEKYIRDHGMEEEYQQYFEQKMQELGAEIQVYAGSDSQGRSKYKPVSLDQVSRMMKRQGRAGGEGGIFADSPGAIRAKLLTPMKTLDQIRAKKDRLVSHEAFEQFRENYQNELREYADVYARGSMGALADIITSGNMAATAKRYNIDLDADAVAELNKFKNRVRSMPTEYFETKFERPVMLDEFRKAIVPDNLPLDLYGALQDAGLDVVEYPAGDNAAREKATLDAVKAEEDMRFSISSGDAAEIGDLGIRFSLRTKAAPTKTQRVYKLMRLGDDGKLYPLFIDAADAIELGVWYDADSPNLSTLKTLSSDVYTGTRTREENGEKITEEYRYGVYLIDNETGEAMSLEEFKQVHKGEKGYSRMGNNPNKTAINYATAHNMRWVKIEQKNTSQRRYGGEARSYYNYGINGAKNGGAVGLFAMRPGWHAGSLPTMRQIGKGTGKNLRDDRFVWVEGVVSADVDYNAEAQANPDKDIPDRIPEDGFYLKSTNANADAAQADRVGWYVAGAFRPDRIIGDREAREIIDQWNAEHPDDEPVEYDFPRESGKVFNAETMQLEDNDNGPDGPNGGKRFSIDDAAYAEAVEAGDRKKVARMVKDAVKAAMPNTKAVDRWGKPRLLYHGTPQENQFYEFDGTIYLSSNRSVANEYTHYRRTFGANPRQTGRIMPVFVNLENPLEIDANRHLWRNIDVEWSDTPVTTRDIEQYAKDNGYDGVIIKRVRDNMYDNDTTAADVYIAFSPEQVKSAGPTYEQKKRSHFPWDDYMELDGEVGATYDDDGNLIPLSERFDMGKRDIRYSLDAAVAEAEQVTETNPTDGQKESGNYRKGHVKVDGFDISIEQPKGSVRSGVDADGNEWSQEMHNTYGYIRGTEGVDGDHIDVFLSDHLDGWNGNVYVVDQVNKDRSFDEHKVMYGFNSEQEARDAYLSNYEEGWTGLGNITGVSREEFKKWVDSSHRKNKPFAEYKNVKPLQSTGTGNRARFSISERTDEAGREVYTETREDGTKDREITTYGDGSKKALWYDDKGNLKERLDYFPNGEVSQVANYDSDGNLTRNIQYDENGRTIRHWEPRIGTDWERDENGVARGMSNGVEMVRYSLAPTFYSNAAKAVENVKQNKATAEQWKAMLTKQGGIKAGEDKWMGLSQWLDEHKGETLTKDQVLEFVRENGVQMEEVGYGELNLSSLQEEFDEIYDRIVDGSGSNNAVTFPKDQAWEELRARYNGGDDFDMAFSLDDRMRIQVDDEGRAGYFLGTNPINSTRLDYTTEGLENKREIAFVVPGVEPYQESDEVHFGPENQGRAVMWVRFGETTDTDGNRVLVIDEIQSNRHQDAREKGYADPKAVKAFNDWMDAKAKEFGVQPYQVESRLSDEEYHKMMELANAAKYDEGAVPAAPFEKNWHEVAMKRMLRLAAEEGFDKVAWTTGMQQAERYDIGKHVDKIEVHDLYDGIHEVEGFKNGVEVFSQQTENGEQGLAELLGKDMARKAYSNLHEGMTDYTDENGRVGFSGEGLQIGGEGMKGFYDQMLPRFMDKYGKRWGVKTGEVQLDTPGQEVMHSVDVTPEMRRSVMEQGQPLFSLSAEQQERQTHSANFKRWFGDWENDPEHASKVVDENGKPLVVYHQTNAKRWINRETGEDWEKLDWRKKMEWENKSQEEWEDAWEEQDFYTFDDRYARQSIEMPAIFFSPENDPHHEYGNRTIAVYLNMRNPAINPDIPNRGVTDTAGRDAMEALKAQGYDGFIRTDEDGNIREYGVFDSNQVKSADENNGEFSRENPDIRFSLSQRERDYTANVLKKLRKAGVNVQLATDEEAKRVLDVAEQVNAELMRGWHGSSADFDEFDHSHMGEGEGAQAFGWGTYITSVKSIGEHYAKIATGLGIGKINVMLRGDIPGVQYKGRSIKMNTADHDGLTSAEYAVAIELSKYPNTPVEQIKKRILRRLKNSKQDTTKEQRELAEINAEDFSVPKRMLYEVEIPNNDGANYLRYDKPVSDEQLDILINGLKQLNDRTREQEDNVKSQLAAIREPAQQEFGDNWQQSLSDDDQSKFNELVTELYALDKKLSNIKDAGNHIGYGDDFRVILDILEDGLGKQETSEFLSSLGFVGIEYPANYHGGGNTEGQMNHVIFNEENLKIVNKTEFLKTSDGTVYGWHDNEGIHLTEAGLNPNTPMHEYTHGLMAMLKEREPEKYQQIVEALKDSEVWQEVLNDELYSSIRDDVDAVASEVASRLSGRESERRANESMPARIKRAIQELWDAVAEWFGVKSPMTADSIARMTLRELERGTNPDGDGPGGGTNGGDGPRFSLSGDGTVEEYNKAVNMTGRTFNVGGRVVKPGITRYNFQEAFQDSILAVKKLQQVVERHFGIKLPTRENAWMYENRLSSINMHERKSFIDKVYEPMMKIADSIMKRGVKEKELNAYLICKHGLERNQVFAARDAQAEADEIVRNGGTPDMQQLLDKYRQRDYSGLTGVTGIEGDIADIEAEAQRIVDEFEQRHGQLCNELWDAIRKATQWSLRKSYQSGMMSAATFDHVRNMFQYYVPLRGWSETTAEDVYSYMMGEHGAFNGVLKRAEGRTSVADDPLATIGNMAESALMQGNKNLLKQHLLRMAQNHPTDVCQVRDVWLVEGPGGVWEPHWPNIPDDATPDEIDQILQDHENDMLQLEAGGSAKRVRNNMDIPYRIDPRHVPEHAVVAKVAGIDHVVYINGNPRAAQAINGQTGAPRGNKSGFSRLIDFIFGDMKRFYSSVLTSLNINFSGANFVRDLPHAYAMTFIKQGPLKAAEYIARSFQVIPWVFKNQLGKTGTSKIDRYFQEFLSSGSVTGYAHINDVDAWKADNKRRFARLSALGKARVAVPRALGEVINAIGWFSETLELIPRFTAFLVERESGKDIATATKAAKDITTNFNKKGSEVTPGVWGAVANTLRYMKMFFNPIVQGMYQFVDVASMGKENKWVGPRMVLATMHLPILGAIVPYLNQFLLEALGGDDDDDYWLLNEYTRRNNVCIFTGNGYVKIPIAPVFREMYGMGEVVATRHAGKADNEKTVIDMIDQLRTMGSVEGQSSYNEWSLARFLLPEHFAPLIDVMNNENFTGGPIYYDNNYKEFAPEYTKAKKSTWSPLVAASKWLNEMMGGDEDIAAGNSGKWMNPAVWQHLITNVGGGFAQLAGDVVSGITDITEGKEIDASNMPVLKRFYSNSSDERAQWARFGIYKDFEKDYTMAKEKYQALDKRGLSLTERADEMVKFAESHPRAAAIYAVWEGGIKGADIPARLEKLGKDDPAYWDLVKEAVGKAEKAMNSGYVRAWEQKRKDRPDSMSDKELNERFDKSDNDSIRHIMADEISKRAGSQDYYGRDAQATWSDKSVAAWEAYQDKRTSDDIKADAELSNLLKVDDDEKDKARIKMLGYIKDELNKIRRGKDATSRSAGVKGLGEGDDERIMEELRAARKQLIEDLKSGSAEQAYRNLERRTMRLGLRKKAKEL